MQGVLPAQEKPLSKRRSSKAWGCGFLAVTVGVIVGVTLPVIALFLLFMIPVWIDDAKLANMVDRFQGYPLPPKTEWIDYTPDASVELRGNGNHCDYRARWTLRTQLSGPELLAYYERAEIEGVEGKRPSITVWLPQPSKRSAYNGDSVAIVELYDGTSAGLDLRCT